MMKDGTLKQLLLLFLILGELIFILNSCIPPRNSIFDVRDLTIERKSNGYLICLSANKRIEGIEAFISKSNWLIITIANASMDMNKVKSLKPLGIIQKIEIDKFESSVQLSMKLSEKGGRVEVVHDPKTNNVFVDLFTSSKN
jgi:hypothetical protein